MIVGKIYGGNNMQQETATQLEAEVTLVDTDSPYQEGPSSVNFSTKYLSALGAALLAACGSHDDAGSANATATKSDSANASQASAVGADASISSQADTVDGYRPPGAVTNSGVSSAAGFNNFPVAYTTNDAARFLLQSQLNATDAEIAAVSSGTFAAYLQQQFAKPIGQTAWDWLEAGGFSLSDSNNQFNFFFSTDQADWMIWNQLFTAQDSMRKRMALGLSEFFVVSLESSSFTWPSHGFAKYWDILVGNAFGNFRTLLEAITLNPAMGYYLNTKGNQKENVSIGRLPDENFAREVMQLFTIGLYQLNLDGSEVVVAGKKVETYTQSDVSNLARVFTGYDFDNTVGKQSVVVYESKDVLATYKVDSKESVSRPMVMTPSNHSQLAATFLGVTVPASTSATAGAAGAAGLQTALNTLFNHPNVGPFFGKQMIQRFVTSNPSPEYVARVAAAFNNNGAGVRGDLKAVWTAIFLDDEARRTYTVQTGAAAANTSGVQNAKGVLNRDISDKTFGKLREPMLRFVQWGRTFGLSPVNATYKYWKIGETSSISDQLGQSPLRSPSVFNYFRPGFVPPNSALSATNSPAPEFQIVNETTVGGYLNYMQNVIKNGIYCYDPELPNTPYTAYKLNVAATYMSELALATDPTALVKRINLLMTAGQISDVNQTLMIAAITSMPANSTVAATLATQKLNRVAAAVLMVMAGGEYLIQK
jgi:uncharacterized protein (DUF1800 family)